MKILVLNAGSSSMKFTLFSMENEQVLAKGQVERLGSDKPNMIYKRSDGYVEEGLIKENTPVGALRKICEKLIDPEHGVLKSLCEIDAIGHRVLHGGEKITAPIRIDAQAKEIIRECFPLGPLHNPANLAGIEACEKEMPGVPNVGVFDTQFHMTMPPEAYLYALPYEYYRKFGIRKYGFHGTSHHYVTLATAKFLGRRPEELNLITCHLGNGCSMAAVRKGKVIDTSMGLTPLEGLVMGTRCGDLDPAAVLRLLELGHSREEVDQILNKQSGLLGVAGIGSSDMRDIIAAEQAGNEQALQARKMFIRRVVKYIGAYYALLDGADALVFTGGIGEWSAYTREHVLSALGCLGIRFDSAKNNETLGKRGVISTPDSKLTVVVMPTDEELMIARSVVKTLYPEKSADCNR